jgi:hypothetical protein
MHSTGAKVLFIEVSCEDEKYLSEHYQKMCVLSPEYQRLPADAAEIDYRKRIEKYREFYVPIDAPASSMTLLIMKS